MISDIDRGTSGDSSVEDPVSYRIDKYSVDLTRRLLFRQRMSTIYDSTARLAYIEVFSDGGRWTRTF